MDAPPGQKVQLTINGRQEKRYVDEGSTGISPSRRRPSAASSMKETARRPKNSTKLVERSTATTMDELGAAAQGMSLGDDRAPEQAWDD